MSRAKADDLHEIALALARYLSYECRPDPNPSGRVTANPVITDDPPRIAHEPADENTPALVPDLEYSVKDAMKITRRAEITLRKMMGSGRLPSRKEGKRVYLKGKDLARIMATQIPETAADAAGAPEA